MGEVKSSSVAELIRARSADGLARHTLSCPSVASHRLLAAKAHIAVASRKRRADGGAPQWAAFSEHRPSVCEPRVDHLVVGGCAGIVDVGIRDDVLRELAHEHLALDVRVRLAAGDNIPPAVAEEGVGFDLGEGEAGGGVAGEHL